MTGRAHGRNFSYLLLMGAGLLFLLAAALYSESLLRHLDPAPPVDKVADKITTARWRLLWLGLGLCLGAGFARRIPGLSTLMQRPKVTNSLLSLLTLAVPLTLAEVTLKPFAGPEATTIFMRDEALGWRLRPNARGTWGGVPVAINGKGLRGPEIDYARTRDALRILYLGDSVTFGFMLADYAASFPYQVETLLEAELAREVETINAGVGGYSPWQAVNYFAGEGLRYQPDLIVVGFVLNDVTEKFELARFGGYGEGYQVTNTLFSRFDAWAGQSSTLYFLKQLAIRLRTHGEMRQAALVQQQLAVEMLTDQPNHPDVQTAWELTLNNLQQILALAQEHAIPIALVVFPFTFQFDDPETLNRPQIILTQFGREHDLPVLDLLPPLAQHMRNQAQSPDVYFLDEDHLSAYGSRVVAEMIVSFLQACAIAPAGP